MKRVDLIDAVPDAVVVAVVLVGDGAMIGNAADAASRGESARVTSHGGARTETTTTTTVTTMTAATTLKIINPVSLALF